MYHSKIVSWPWQCHREGGGGGGGGGGVSRASYPGPQGVKEPAPGPENTNRHPIVRLCGIPASLFDSRLFPCSLA